MRKAILTAAVTAAVFGMPALAAATPAGDTAAHNAGRAAERKFGQVTPDRWDHAKTGCRSASTWRYWHCRSKITGRHGYRGVFRVLVNQDSLVPYVRDWTIIAP